MELKDSRTRENLMRAFAGESQARNRYTFAAGIARQKSLHVVEAVFLYTAEQEKAHGQIFYDLLKDGKCGDAVLEGAGYPVDLTADPMELLEAAAGHESQEHDEIYPRFAEVAKEEGFAGVEQKFRMIADIEKSHQERFERFEKLMREGKLFVSDVDTGWVCLNCGFVTYGKEAPKTCPVCGHDQGYFIRLELSPYTR